MSRRRRPLAALLVLAAVSMPARAPAAGSEFVTASGQTLMVGGQPWVAVGVNQWDFDPFRALDGDIAGCYYQHANIDAYLDGLFRRVAEDVHATAVRTFGFWAPFTDGGRDWSSTDRLLYYARKHDVRVIPVLGGQYEICGSPAKPYDWYLDGYRRPEPAWGISYRDYVVAVARRYRDDPTIAMWQLMNEPDPSVAGDTVFREAPLVDFARDMGRAIRVEAGDANHLIQMGAKGANHMGTRPPVYGRLIECGPSSGGCTDVAEAHAFNFFNPLPGSPHTASVRATIEAWNEAGDRLTKEFALHTDEWMSLQFRGQAAGPTLTRWALRLDAPASPAWTAYVNRATIYEGEAHGAVHYHEFDDDLEGFASDQAALSTSMRHGASSMRIDVPASGAPSRTTIRTPVEGARVFNVHVDLRLDFNAPADDVGTIVSNLHAAVIARRTPFLIGEAGIEARVPGIAACAGARTLADRANTFDMLLTGTMDPDHLSSGVIAWDFKDPAVQTLRPDGTLGLDPGLSCWSIPPGDPTIPILRRFADRAGSIPPLSPPATLPAPVAHLASLSSFPSAMAAGADVPVLARVTNGGSPVRNALVRATGACVGSARTDALGHVSFTCRGVGSGPGSITLAVDTASCGCAPNSIVTPVVVKTRFAVRAAVGVVERGTSAPVTMTVTDPAGVGAASSVPWSIARCNASGVIPAGKAVWSFPLSCPVDASWSAVEELRFVTPDTPAAFAGTTAFPAYAFDRIYVDAGGRECLGIDLSTPAAGTTTTAGRCGPGGFGTTADWCLLQRSEVTVVPAAAATATGSNASCSIEGTFSTMSDSFAAVVRRADGAHLFASA